MSMDRQQATAACNYVVMAEEVPFMLHHLRQ
jgi:hypothetical protein